VGTGAAGGVPVTPGAVDGIVVYGAECAGSVPLGSSSARWPATLWQAARHMSVSRLHYIAMMTLFKHRLKLEPVSADQSGVRSEKREHQFNVGGILRKFLEVIRSPSLAVALLNAQLRIRGRASLPFSVRLRGRIRIAGRGNVELGNGITLIGNIVPVEFVAHSDARILVGDHTFINYGASISAHELVTIGRHCHLGHYCLIIDNNEHDIRQHEVLPPSKPVMIEDHVWIGSRVLILPGVRIGHHAVIGGGSVVTSDVPAHCVAAGNPARIVRSLS
jgi:acetyltransferase-like isoleucine patch superfamily enzyme